MPIRRKWFRIIGLLSLMVIISCVPTYAKSRDVTREYSAKVARVIAPFDAYLNRGERSQRFKFDDYARTSLSLFRMEDITGVSPYGKYYRDIKKKVSSAWKKLFTKRVRQKIKKTSNNGGGFFYDISYAYLLNDKGKITHIWGDPGEDDQRVGRVKKVTKEKKNSFRVTYDLYRYDWLNDKVCELKSTWYFVMKKAGSGFKIQSIKRSAVY